ncbi:MAG: response regulator transcription factor [Pseudomonadota bacterium]
MNSYESLPGNDAESVHCGSILIVDDHPLFRDALTGALAPLRDRFQDVLHAHSIASACAVLDAQPVDRVLLDLNLPDAEQFSGLQHLRGRYPDLAIYVVSAADELATIQTAQTLGARGFLPKVLENATLSDALAAVISEQCWFPANFEAQTDDSPAARVATLTPAQQRVMEGLAEGLLNKQIADRMDISVATVKAHMTAILRKLNATNRTQALLVYRHGLGIG